MKTAMSQVEPFTLRRWLVTGLQGVHWCATWQFMRRPVVAVAGSLAFFVCCGGSAMASQVDARVASSRVVAAPIPCSGDCNSDGAVTVDEILLLTSIALAEVDVVSCPPGDVSHDSQITIDEIITAVNSALNGCEALPATPSPTPAATSTPTGAPTASPTSTPSGIPTGTPTHTSSPTAGSTSTPTVTPKPTSPVSMGPLITYFGLAGQDRGPLPTIGADVEGNPIFTKPPNANGRGFYIVVEAGSGSSGSLPGTMTINSDPTGRPDLQIQADRKLGDGSLLVCDAAPVGPGPTPTITPGGVPPINASTTNQQYITDALNDFGCRFVVKLSSDEAITEPTPQIPRFVNPPASLRQYISPEPIGSELALDAGDTLLTVRVRDLAGNLGDPKSIVLRVPTPAPAGVSETIGP